MRVKSLHLYPVKSGQGIDVQTAAVRPRGLAGDRRYMLVDNKGVFISQRSAPKLAQLTVRLRSDGLSLSAPDMPELVVTAPSNDLRSPVKIWRDTVSAACVNADVSDALSRWLGLSVSLVYMDTQSERAASSIWTATPSQVSFADGYPILITNTASLTALNEHIIQNGQPSVPMTRFRPNIVIESGEAWGEDMWKTLKIGGAIFDLVKPCTRCIMTTLDQATGQKLGREPLRSLRTLRMSTDARNEGVLFGMNAVVRVCADISVGEAAQCL